MKKIIEGGGRCARKFLESFLCHRAEKRRLGYSSKGNNIFRLIFVCAMNHGCDGCEHCSFELIKCPACPAIFCTSVVPTATSLLDQWS